MVAILDYAIIYGNVDALQIPAGDFLINIFCVLHVNILHIYLDSVKGLEQFEVLLL